MNSQIQESDFSIKHQKQNLSKIVIRSQILVDKSNLGFLDMQILWVSVNPRDKGFAKLFSRAAVSFLQLSLHILEQYHNSRPCFGLENPDFGIPNTVSELQPKLSIYQCEHNWRKRHRAHRNSFVNPSPGFLKKQSKPQTIEIQVINSNIKTGQGFWCFKLCLLISQFYYLESQNLDLNSFFLNPDYSLKNSSSPANNNI